MSNNSELLKEWNEVKSQYLQLSANSQCDELDAAIADCRRIYDSVKEESDGDVYGELLATYVHLLLFRVEHILGNGDVQASVTLLQEAVAVEREAREKKIKISERGLSGTLYLLAKVCQAGEVYDEAEAAFKESLEVCDEEMQRKGKSGVMSENMSDMVVDLAHFYLSQNRINEAIDRYLQAIELYRVAVVASDEAVKKLLQLYSLLKEIYNLMHDDNRAAMYEALEANIDSEVQELRG